MKMNKISSIFAAIFITMLFGNYINSVNVLSRPQITSDMFAKSIGDGFQRGFDQGWQDTAAARERKRIQKEEESRRKKETLLLQEILKDYNYENHTNCILKIAASELSYQTKEIISIALQKEHEQERKSRHWFWKWFQ